MIILGLTGSIGMGKTTIAKMMQNMRIPVHESDAEVHELLGVEGDAVKAVAKAFPESYNKKLKSIDRKILGESVFKDHQKRLLLESILHPMVQTAQQNFIKNVAPKKPKFVCLDIPLLFETDAEKRVDFTLLATAPFFIQRARVLRRPKMTEERFLNILAQQMPDTEKRQRADYMIHTGLGLAHSLKSLKLILMDIEKKTQPQKQEKKAKKNDPRNRPRY